MVMPPVTPCSRMSPCFYVVRQQITVSAGIGVCRFEVDSQDQPVSRADTALCQAKRSGGNRVCCDEDCADYSSGTDSAVGMVQRRPPGDSKD